MNQYFYNDPFYLKFALFLKNQSDKYERFKDTDEDLLSFLNEVYENLIIHECDDEFNLPLRMSLEW